MQCLRIIIMDGITCAGMAYSPGIPFFSVGVVVYIPVAVSYPLKQFAITIFFPGQLNIQTQALKIFKTLVKPIGLPPYSRLLLCPRKPSRQQNEKPYGSKFFHF